MNWHYHKHSRVQPMLLPRHRFSPFSEDARITASPSLLLLLTLREEAASLIIPSICHQNAHCCRNSDLQEFPVHVLDYVLRFKYIHCDKETLKYFRTVDSLFSNIEKIHKNNQKHLTFSTYMVSKVQDKN